MHISGLNNSDSSSSSSSEEEEDTPTAGSNQTANPHDLFTQSLTAALSISSDVAREDEEEEEPMMKSKTNSNDNSNRIMDD
jgi:hypothetical protein